MFLPEGTHHKTGDGTSSHQCGRTALGRCCCTCQGGLRTSHAQTQRRDNWDDGEVRILLEVWGDDRVQADLEGTSRNITIYRRIADRLDRGLGEVGTNC